MAQTYRLDFSLNKFYSTWKQMPVHVTTAAAIHSRWTEQRFNKTNDSTPGTKITAVTAATKNSGPLSRMTLESTRIQPF